jgi:hypothetical protein
VILADRAWQGYARLSWFEMMGTRLIQLRSAVPLAFLLALGATRHAADAATPPVNEPLANPTADAVPLVPPAVPVSKGGFMVPKMVVLRPMTEAETAANAIWNMRAALNVAALQCQFSPFLNTVNNYNAMLKHHSDELARAQATMVAHFKRYDGAARALNNFDQYTTRTYNSYSTLDAQYAFCEAAGRVGREVLATPRGKMGPEALRRNPEIRAALLEQPLSPALALTAMAPIAIEPIGSPEL